MDTPNFSKEDLLNFVEKNKSHQYVVVMFTTEWCSACKRMLNTFEQLLKKKEEEDILFLQVDAEKNPTLSKDPFFAVSTIPKTFIFRGGVFWKQLEGSIDLHSLENFLQL